MKKQLTSFLQELIDNGYRQMGEVVFSPGLPEQKFAYRLCHYRDAGSHAARITQSFYQPEDALTIALYDERGDFRPLKTAPTLKRGWAMELKDIKELQQALDFFYPALLGVFFADQKNQLKTNNLRETVNRQSGMYRIVSQISNAEADQLAASICCSKSQCLRTVLWSIDDACRPAQLPSEKLNPQYNQSQAEYRAIPLLCFEVCNLFIARSRQWMRQKQETKQEAPQLV